MRLGIGWLLATGITLAGTGVAYGQDMPTGPGARNVTALACAPRAVREVPPALGQVVSGIEPRKTTLTIGDTLLVGGFAEGTLAPGQQYFVRRALPPLDKSQPRSDAWINLHTVAWIRITSVEGAGARATVTYACDAIALGDYLATFAVPVLPDALLDEREPDFESPGQVLFGLDQRGNHGAGTYVAVDRGTDAGVRAGQHLAFFRREGTAGTVVVLGSGLVVEATAISATVLVEKAAQPIANGDLVAFRR